MLDIYCLSKQKEVAFKVMNYSSLQSNSCLLNLALSSINGHCNIPQDPKQDLKIKEALHALCIRIRTFQARASMEKDCVWIQFWLLEQDYLCGGATSNRGR